MEKKILGSKFFGKKKHIRNSRSSETFLETNDDKTVKAFHNKPNAKSDKAPSTHYVGEKFGRYAYPTITEK